MRYGSSSPSRTWIDGVSIRHLFIQGDAKHRAICRKTKHLLSNDFFIYHLVENEIVVELKAVDGILPVHKAQLLTYLKLSEKKLGCSSILMLAF